MYLQRALGAKVKNQIIQHSIKIRPPIQLTESSMLMCECVYGKLRQNAMEAEKQQPDVKQCPVVFLILTPALFLSQDEENGNGKGRCLLFLLT